jgi:hypothetical protein
MAGPEDLVQRYVSDLLNGTRVELVDELFSPRYVGHDPVSLPGGPRRLRGATETIVDVRNLISALASTDLDFAFTLEDVFHVGTKIAYRVFGEGLIAVQAGNSPIPDPVRASGKLLGDQLHLEYRCTGIFRLDQNRFAERWGVQALL